MPVHRRLFKLSGGDFHFTWGDGVMGGENFVKSTIAVIVIALVLGGIIFMLGRARREREEVLAHPPIDVPLAKLVKDGPGENRHVNVTAFEWADGYVEETKNGSTTGLWIPIFPQGQPPREIRAVVKFPPGTTAKALPGFLDRTTLRGIWSDSTSGYGATLSKEMLNVNPGTTLDEAWELDLDASVRTGMAADTLFATAYVCFGVVALAGVLLAVRGRAVERERLNFTWGRFDDRLDFKPTELRQESGDRGGNSAGHDDRHEFPLIRCLLWRNRSDGSGHETDRGRLNPNQTGRQLAHRADGFRVERGVSTRKTKRTDRVELGTDVSDERSIGRDSHRRRSAELEPFERERSETKLGGNLRDVETNLSRRDATAVRTKSPRYDDRRSVGSDGGPPAQASKNYEDRYVNLIVAIFCGLLFTACVTYVAVRLYTERKPSLVAEFAETPQPPDPGGPSSQ
ncbi:MAG: hypothetical protein QM811_07280 [Pirellulales bacterium]